MPETSLRLMCNLSRVLSGDLKQGLMERLENGRETDYNADASNNADRYDSGNRTSMWPLKLRIGTILETQLLRQGKKWIHKHPELCDRGGLADDTVEKTWKSFGYLTYHPYWHRVRIQQEMVLCREFSADLICCGTEMATYVPSRTWSRSSAWYLRSTGAKTHSTILDCLLPRVDLSTTRAEWDNYADRLQPEDSPAALSVSACASACAYEPSCLQYSYNEGQCKFGGFFQFGHSAPNTDYTSGWDMEKILGLGYQTDPDQTSSCKEATWLKPDIL